MKLITVTYLIAALLLASCATVPEPIGVQGGGNVAPAEVPEVEMKAIGFDGQQGTCLADLDRSGRVDTVDLAQCRRSYGMVCPTQPGRFAGVIEVWTDAATIIKPPAPGQTTLPPIVTTEVETGGPHCFQGAGPQFDQNGKFRLNTVRVPCPDQ